MDSFIHPSIFKGKQAFEVEVTISFGDKREFLNHLWIESLSFKKWKINKKAPTLNIVHLIAFTDKKKKLKQIKGNQISTFQPLFGKKSQNNENWFHFETGLIEKRGKIVEKIQNDFHQFCLISLYLNSPFLKEGYYCFLPVTISPFRSRALCIRHCLSLCRCTVLHRMVP